MRDGRVKRVLSKIRPGLTGCVSSHDCALGDWQTYTPLMETHGMLQYMTYLPRVGWAGFLVKELTKICLGSFCLGLARLLSRSST